MVGYQDARDERDAWDEGSYPPLTTIPSCELGEVLL